MKHFFYLFFVASFLVACSSSKYYLSQPDVDNAIYDAVDALTEKATNTSASKALPILYANAQKKHLGNIAALSKSKDLGRWNSILSTYEILQGLNDAINDCSPAAKLVKTVDYQPQIEQARQIAAEECYQMADNLLKSGTRADAFKAYEHYKMAIGFVPDFKDGNQKMDVAFNKSTLHVLVRPFIQIALQDDPNKFADLMRTFQKTRRILIADLESQVSAEYPVKFYTYMPDSPNDGEIDCTIDVSLHRFHLGDPTTNIKTEERVGQYIESYDTSGNPFFTNVRTTVNTWKTSTAANISVGVYINEAASNQALSSKIFKENYNWQSEWGNYWKEDWNTNEDGSRIPVGLNTIKGYPSSRESAFMQLYSQVHPRLLAHIRNVLNAHLKNKGFLSQ